MRFCKDARPRSQDAPGPRLRRRAAAVAVLIVLLAPAGAIAQAVDELVVESGYTVIAQTSDDDALKNSTTGSLDLRLAWSPGNARIEAYLEGNTSLRANGIATHIPRSNADAGTALDPDRSGRFQVSELKYSYEWPSERSIAAGLIDPSAYLDVTRISNDENQQFLGASFVNNPTIEFPDYTLGVVAQVPAAGHRPKWSLVLAGSNGISDNPNLSYSQVLNVSEGHKGLFAGAESAWLSEPRRVRVGAWLNTAEHETLDGVRTDATNYGFYGTLGASRGSLAANLRLGLAHSDVSLGDRFASLSMQWDHGRHVLGVALARTWVSSEAPSSTRDHSLHAESYLRLKLARGLYLTPSLQYLVHGGFDASVVPLDNNVMVASIRLHHLFAGPR